MDLRQFESGAAAGEPATPATPSEGFPTAGNPATGTPATRPGPYWYHQVGESLRAVIVAAGLTPDHTDLTQLLGAIQSTAGGGGSMLPIYPEIETVDHRLAVVDNDGSVLVSAAQTWVMRGSLRYSSDDYASAELDFIHAANKTYHLRWTLAGGFALKDLADVAYNPGSLAEDHESFDTTYDDMLVARVVTDAGNVPVITPLANAARLNATVIKETIATSGTGSPNDSLTAALDWAVTPDVRFRSYSLEGTSSMESVKQKRVANLSRYGAELQILGYYFEHGTSAVWGYISGQFTADISTPR